MSRVQLALNVADLDASIEFYTKLFGTEPAKVREGYANFAIANPPLKLVLFTGMGEPGSLNHIGVEVGLTWVILRSIVIGHGRTSRPSRLSRSAAYQPPPMCTSPAKNTNTSTARRSKRMGELCHTLPRDRRANRVPRCSCR